MPEVAEPPTTTETVQPQVEKKEPLTGATAGERWKTEFAKLQKEEAEVPKPPTEKPEPPKEEPKAEPKTEEKPAEPEFKPAAEQPKSPLDVITSDKKTEEEPDVLKDLDGVTKPGSEHWSKLKSIAKAQSERAKSLEQELSKLKEAPKAQPDEILAITKERDALKEKYEKQEESLKALNYQYSETFQNMVADRDAHVNKIQARVERLGGDTEKFMAALAMPDGRAKNAQIKEALAEVDSEDRTRIHTLLETLDEKNEKLALEAKNSSSKWDELQTKRSAELAEEQAKGLKSIETTFSQIASALPETVVTMREVPGDDEWNAEIKAAMETAMRVLTPGGSDQKESMEIAIKGGRYDSLEKRLLSVHKELVEARKRLSEYDSGGPEFKGGPKPKVEAKMSPSQKYHKALESLKSTDNG